MKRLTKLFNSNERGTTMTEFVMTLPMFILAFIGVIQLGHVSEISVRTWAKAHRNTFEVALLPSKVRWSPHMQPAVGGGIGAATLGLGSPNSTTGVQTAFYTASELSTYGLMAWKGHWGESQSRTFLLDTVVDFRYVDSHVTMDSSDIIGDSEFAKALVDEEAGNFSGSGGGALGAVNALISGTGVRPAIAAGMRYGAVGAWSDDTISVLGRDVSTRASFNTLVPPFPLKDFEAAAVPTGIVRITMESYDPYAEVLGIAWDQPYPGGSGNAPGLGFPR